ncbi:signal peptidase I [Pseudonocardia endophytica]|uniref:Signal peptidase I n=2 Tax=Pseudonocardia endophytica TaxID=401976 RepID=A0A4R1HVL3_PSEEN|nr:signal peptidase I [Pseudonocardia endophytica]
MDPGRTRRPPPRRPGREPEPVDDDLPDEDDVDTTALPTERQRRTPRRRPVAGDAPRSRTRAPADDDVDDRDDVDDGIDARDSRDEDARVAEPRGPVGVGGRIAALTSRRRSRDGGDGKKQTSFWKELPLLVGVALLLTFLIQTFVAKVFVIPSGSMETTLNGCTGCDNDRVLVDKVTYNFTDIKPGDVVVFRGPDSWSSSEYELDQTTNPVLRGLQMAGSLIGFAPPDEKDFVKRVIATGGQTVACCDALNQVMVDGQPLEEPYIYYLPEAGPARQIPFGPVTVPQGEMWMMGDSRNNSADSRAAGHGPVPEENVIGKVRLIVLPFDRFGWVDAVNPQTNAQAAADHGLPQGGALALGMMGAFPFALGRRRLLVRRAEEQRFLPVARRRKRWRT